jgi:phosphopantothenoylcysteine decarboxylase/phosphopantothenate--cysteine ligase
VSATTDPADGRLAGRQIVLAVTGGIAAYKSCELVRRLRDHGATVRVVMTRSATRFVSPTTFAALSGQRVISDMFADRFPEEIAHVRWAESAELFCVAPATADFLAKMAHGVADDFPSTLHLAVTCPVVVAPAMEDDMYRHSAVQRNLSRLRQDGVETVGPDSGWLASGRRGPGRMSEPGTIVAAALRLLEDGARDRWLAGKRVLVVSGPTHEAIDPVRFLGNRSSGRMGHAVALEACRLGAAVEMVSGPGTVSEPPGVQVHAVTSAAEMAAAVRERADSCDIVVMAAAVADYTPATPADEKIKKVDGEDLELTLVRTEDILGGLGKAPSPRPLLVGFAAESSQLAERAGDKLARKGCDLIVANAIGDGVVGMGGTDNEVLVIDRLGGSEAFGPAPKSRVATFVWDRVRAFAAAEAT